jgi:hypothetical protein
VPEEDIMKLKTPAIAVVLSLVALGLGAETSLSTLPANEPLE